MEEAVLICKSRTGSAHFAHPRISLPHTHTHTIALMSSESSSSRPNVSFSRFQDLFEAALLQYSQKTGKDIATDPLTTRLLSCGSSDEVLSILQEQAHAFNQYRNGDWKIQLMKRLRPTVNILIGLSTSGVFGEGIGLVRMTKVTYCSYSTFITEISTSEGDICWCWSPTRSTYPFVWLPVSAVLTSGFYRPLRELALAMTHLSSSSNVLNITLAVSKSSPRFPPL
jgi:hypothetical protein